MLDIAAGVRLATSGSIHPIVQILQHGALMQAPHEELLAAHMSAKGRRKETGTALATRHGSAFPEARQLQGGVLQLMPASIPPCG